MINPSDILQLCRLCLVEDAVNHSIFEDSGDLRSIFLKISSCLPVSIHKDDGLPEKICETCSTKLDTFYQFWNETANAEKQLLQWLKQTTTKKSEETIKKMDATEVKQEETEESNMDPIDMSSDAQTYILQQQQLPYASAPTDSINTSESDEPVSKRPRRASAVRALEQMESEDEDDPDVAPDNYAKTESDDSEKEEEEDNDHQENPSITSMEEQPGPSGIVKKRVVLDDTPSLEPICQVVIDEEDDNPYCCGKEFGSPNAKKKHLKQQHGPKKFPCTECDKKFTCGYQLKVHSQTHSDTKEFKCTLCERSFKTDKYLENHMNYNHIRGNFRHQCACCEKSYRSEKELNQHIGTKHLGIVYKCEICFKEFYSDMYLKKHMLQHDESYVPPTVPCTQCDKVFSCKRSLTVHVESFHHGIRHICEICGKSLSTQYSLRLHMRTHSDEKPFECEICGKKFAKSSTRQDHLRIHTKQRPHVCPNCGKGFTQRTPLITHLKSVHGSERPFQCPMCPKAFATKSLLKTHSKVHGKPLGSA